MLDYLASKPQEPLCVPFTIFYAGAGIELTLCTCVASLYGPSYPSPQTLQDILCVISPWDRSQPFPCPGPSNAVNLCAPLVRRKYTYNSASQTEINTAVHGLKPKRGCLLPVLPTLALLMAPTVLGFESCPYFCISCSLTLGVNQSLPFIWPGIKYFRLYGSQCEPKLSFLIGD